MGLCQGFPVEMRRRLLVYKGVPCSLPGESAVHPRDSSMPEVERMSGLGAAMHRNCLWRAGACFGRKRECRQGGAPGGLSVRQAGHPDGHPECYKMRYSCRLVHLF